MSQNRYFSQVRLKPSFKFMLPAFRCKQVLLLTHEGASMAEWEPYMSYRLRPCRPLVFYGRSASRKPPCSKEHAVWWVWKDHRSLGHVCFRPCLDYPDMLSPSSPTPHLFRCPSKHEHHSMLRSMDGAYSPPSSGLQSEWYSELTARS